MLTNGTHIGILFDPRSGSHVFQHFLCEALNSSNYLELFNAGVTIKLMENEVATTGGLPPIIGDQNRIDILNKRFEWFTATQPSSQSVFKIYVESYCKIYPEFSSKLAGIDNCQFIRLKRADALSGILSALVANTTGIWHVDSNAAVSAIHNKWANVSRHIDLDELKNELTSLVDADKHIAQYFGQPRVVYYEEFQLRLLNICNIFPTIPRRLVGSHLSRITEKISYKTCISNLDEVEDFYEQFVNEHKEYFPQYFGKLPHIKIPASHGRQPRDLSLELTDIREESASENQPFYCE